MVHLTTQRHLHTIKSIKFCLVYSLKVLHKKSELFQTYYSSHCIDNPYTEGYIRNFATAVTKTPRTTKKHTGATIHRLTYFQFLFKTRDHF